MTDDLIRCAWIKDPLMQAYHDEEWGEPVHDDTRHHEFLILDAFQAGLSWAIILKKREGFRRAFAGFEPERVARFTPARVQKILRDPGIVRNKLKVRAAVTNARAFLAIQHEFGSFDKFIWQFMGWRTKHNTWTALKQLPARTKESDRMSESLKTLGFQFVGSTICYSYMQAAGMVNDHLTKCFRYRELAGPRGSGSARSATT